MNTCANPPVTDDIFIDAVAELLNIGMGQAAKALSDMLQDEICLSVPWVRLLQRSEAAGLIEDKLKDDVSGVLQRFRGSAFEGDVLLLFPEEKSLDLVKALINEEPTQEDLTDMEQEAMTEVGNIILNACICTIADLFHKEIYGGIPEFIKGNIRSIIASDADTHDQKSHVLLVNMDFAIATKHIEGYVTFLMDLKSVATFRANIEAYILG